MRAISILVAGIVLRLAAPAVAQDCEAARCAVQQAINDNCTCEQSHNGKNNHGQYVSCVTHQLKTLSDQGAIPVNCKGAVTRCTARSTCGKKTGFSVCLIPTDACTVVAGACDLVAGTCLADASRTCAADADCGTCAADPTLACTADLDCGSRCKISSTPERCAARGGTVDPTRTTCCANCSAPVP